MIPRRALFFLVALVLAVHVLLLTGASASSVRPARPAQPQAFETRSISLAAPEPPAAAAPPSAKPKPRPAVRAAPTAQKPRAQQAPSTEATAATPAPPPPAADWAAAPPVWALPSVGELMALDGSGSPPEEAQATQTLPPAAPADDAVRVASSPAAALVASAVSVKPSAAEPSAPTSGTASLPPVKLPPPARLDFEVIGQAKGFGYNAGAVLVWQHDATSYSAHQEIKVFLLGSRSQSSAGSVTEFGLQPRRFGDRARSERAAHFDFASGRVTFSANTPAAPIEPGAQDRLSVFLQLGSMLAAAPDRYPAGTRIAMTTVSARAADVWTFSVEPEQTLELPVGTVRAVPLQRLPRHDHDQKAQVWLAPGLGYLPVRIRLTEANGDFAELNLQSREAP